MQASSLQTVFIALGERSYPILIGPGLLDAAGTILSLDPEPRTVTVVPAHMKLSFQQDSSNRWEFTGHIGPFSDVHQTVSTEVAAAASSALALSGRRPESELDMIGGAQNSGNGRSFCSSYMMAISRFPG